MFYLVFNVFVVGIIFFQMVVNVFGIVGYFQVVYFYQLFSLVRQQIFFYYEVSSVIISFFFKFFVQYFNGFVVFNGIDDGRLVLVDKYIEVFIGICLVDFFEVQWVVLENKFKQCINFFFINFFFSDLQKIFEIEF